MWHEQINEILAEVHPVEIEEHIIKPAIKQVIEDIEDSIESGYYNEGDDENIKELNQQLLDFWKSIQKQIEVNND